MLVSHLGSTVIAESPSFQIKTPKAPDASQALYEQQLKDYQAQQQLLQQQNEKQQDDDRAKDNKQAAATAAMGAAMAGMSCMMLMKQAQETQDPAMKNMLMTMAMQQCAQAAQNAAAGKQNKSNAKQLTQPPPTPPTQLASADDNSASVEQTAQPANPGPNFEESSFEEFENPLTADEKTDFGFLDDTTGNTNPFATAQGPAITTQSPINFAKLGFNEKGDGLSKSPSGVSNGTFSGGAIVSNAHKDDGLGAKAEKASDSNEISRKIGNALESDSGGYSGSSDSSSKSGTDMSSMMSSLFGGGDSMGLLTSNGLEVMSLGGKTKDNKAAPSMNIFQFASMQYQVIAKSDNRLRATVAEIKTSPFSAKLSIH